MSCFWKDEDTNIELELPSNNVPCTNEEAEKEKFVAELITIIVTTSVVQTNPETVFIQDVLDSYMNHEPLLRGVRKLIMCDGILVNREVSIYRTGRVNEEAAENYAEYVRRLCELSENATDKSMAFYNSEIVKLNKRRGFALALNEGLRLAKTPYVFVVQHDRLAMKPFGLYNILHAMETFPFAGVNYVCLPTRTTHSYPLTTLRMGYDVRDYALTIPNTGNLPLGKMVIVPMVLWFDSTHICRRNFYLNFILQKPTFIGMHDVGRKYSWKVGDFVEDKLGQIMREQIKAHGFKMLFRYGSFCLTFEGDGSLQYPPKKNSALNAMDFYRKFLGEEIYAEFLRDYPTRKVREDQINTHVVVMHRNQRRGESLLQWYDRQHVENALNAKAVWNEHQARRTTNNDDDTKSSNFN